FQGQALRFRPRTRHANDDRPTPRRRHTERISIASWDGRSPARVRTTATSQLDLLEPGRRERPLLYRGQFEIAWTLLFTVIAGSLRNPPSQVSITHSRRASDDNPSRIPFRS